MTRRSVDWEQALATVGDAYPHIANLDWAIALNDTEVMGRMIRDILKAEPTNAKGRKVQPTPETHGHLLKQLAGDDYTTRSFADATALLLRAHLMSDYELASKTGISRTTLRRFIKGEKTPDLWTVSEVAKVFGKSPAYFPEYRTAAIASALIGKLSDHPDFSITMFDKMQRGTL